MTAPKLAAAVKTALAAWKQATNTDERSDGISRPAELSMQLAQVIEAELVNAGEDLAVVRQDVLSAAYIHLPGVFEPTDLPDTPDWFIPVPDTDSTIFGRAAALATHGFLEMESVSYGSENDGELFVNLTPIGGEGKFARKSKDGLRGHTDAVSFPFNGDSDASNPRIAPSPDFVTLVGLRNPNSVSTKIMVLESVLAKLAPHDIEELKKDQYSIESQATFIEGMKDILGGVHTAIDVPVLKDSMPGTFVRYSHSSVAPTEPGGAAQTASENFEAACNEVAVSVTIKPGDLLLVSNRLCLHGRGLVGGDVGGESRWLLRTYGLDTSELDENRRHLGARPKHVLFP
jgi:L-asparagine oxygenase